MLSAIALGACGDDIATPPDAPPIDAPPEPDPAVLAMTPQNADLGDVLVGSTGASSTFTVSNTTNGTSGSISAIVTGANASEFVVTNGCTTLAEAGTCTVTVAVRPTSAGEKAGTLVVSGSPGGTVMATLTATGVTQGSLAILPSTLAFGNQTVGSSSAAQTFTVTNTGSTATSALTVSPVGANPSDFDLGADDCTGETLAGGASCTIEVSFSPTSAGNKEAGFSIAATTGGSVTGTVTGTGLTGASLNLSPLFADFGQVLLNQSSTNVTFTLTNTGGVVSDTIATPTVSDSNFVIVSETCGATLAGGDSCNIVVAFRPTTAGQKSGTLNVNAGASGTPSASLIGEGRTPGELSISPTPFNYATTSVGATSGSQIFTVTNTGGTTTTAISTALGGTNPAEFQIVAGGNGCQGATLAPLANCTIAVVFSPTSAGAKAANLTANAATGGTANAVLTGTAQAGAAFELAPVSRDFGSVVTGQNSPFQSFTLTNVGGQASTVPAIALNGVNASQFNLATPNPCPTALAAGDACTIMVRFSPTTPGAKVAQLTATAGSVVANAALSGEGIQQAGLVPNPTLLTFPVTDIGDAAPTQTFTVTNNGAQTSGTLAFAFTGTDAADYTQTNNCTILVAAEFCTVTVTFEPRNTVGAGPRNASLTISAAPGGSASVALAGTATRRIELVSPSSPFAYPDSNQDPDVPTVQPITFRNNTSGSVALTTTETDVGDDFDIVSNSCTTVAAGATCVVSVAFDPQALGPQTATISVNITGSADPDDAASITLNGTANNNTLRISDGDGTPTAHGFGNVPVNSSSAPRTFTVTNAGGSATGILAIDLTGAGFQVDSNTCSGVSLPDAGSCTISVNFTPAATGAANGSVVVRSTTGLGGTATATFTGTGTAATAIATPATVDFGTLFAGETSTLLTDEVVTVTNPNDVTTNLTITETSDPNTAFSRVVGGAGDCGATLAGGATCTVTLRFTSALGTGPRTGTYVISQSVGGQSFTVNLTGTVRSSISIVADPAPFATLVTGQTESQTIMVRNDTTNQTITPFTVTAGGDPFFILNNTCTTLAPAATCSFTVQFAPTAANTFNRVLSVTGGTTGLDSAPVTGTAITPADVEILGAASVDFGSALAGQNGGTFVFTVDNLGQQTTGTLAADFGGSTDFTVTANTCTTLTATATCTLTVRFNPVTAGAKSVTLTVSGTPGGADTVTLTGLGQAGGSVTVTPSTFTFANTTAGTNSANTTFTVQNTGAASATLAIADGSAEFERTGGTCGATLAAGASCTVLERFTPTSPGDKTATLTILPGTTASLFGRGLTLANVTNNLGATFANTAAIAIPTSGDATPNPSTITVSGIQGNVGNVRVRLLGFGHTWPDDVDVLLVSPSGARLTLMSDTCGQSTVSNLNLTFADDAGSVLPTSGCSTGTFRPTDRTDFFGPPVDSWTIGGGVASAPNGTATLASQFSGTVANGVWSLYVRDDAGPDAGTIAGGWELTVNSIDFGPQQIATTSGTRTITFTNNGETTAQPLVSTQSGANGDQFVITNNCQGVALAPAASCTVVAAFAPTTPGPKTTQLNFTGPGTFLLPFQGEGASAATLSVTPSVPQAEGSRAIGDLDTAATVFTFSNAVGAAPTSAITFSLSNDANYDITGGTCVTNQILQPGASCTVAVSFNPTQLGAQNTNVTATATQGGTVSGSITGTGTNALVAVTASPVTFTPAAAGNAGSQQTIQFRNDAEVPTALVQTTLSNTAGSDFSVVSDACGGQSIAPNTTCNVVVRFVPSGTTGTRTGSLTVASSINGTATSASVTLSSSVP